MRRPPRIVFPEGMTEAELAEVREVVATDQNRWRVSVDKRVFDRAVVNCDVCDCMWTFWVSVEQARSLGGAAWQGARVASSLGLTCPACDPDPTEMTPAQRRALVLKLAQTDAVDEMRVAADFALGQGRAWHNPEDLAEIERLRAELAEIGYGTVPE